jgi:nitroreductase
MPDTSTAALAHLLGRRSVSPKRLTSPGPGLEEIDLMLQAALRAPDHGGLRPWRIVEFRSEQRAALAEQFEQEKLRRDPLASPLDRRRARDHALRPPVLLAFIVAPLVRSKIPVREQWLAGGAALGNLLNAAHLLGYGAVVLSGERCFDAVLSTQIGVRPDEHLVGFISIGRVAQAPPEARTVLPATVWSCWIPDAQSESASVAVSERRS